MILPYLILLIHNLPLLTDVLMPVTAGSFPFLLLECLCCYCCYHCHHHCCYCYYYQMMTTKTMTRMMRSCRSSSMFSSSWSWRRRTTIHDDDYYYETDQDPWRIVMPRDLDQYQDAPSRVVEHVGGALYYYSYGDDVFVA